MTAVQAGYAPTALTNGYEFTSGSGYTLPEYPFVAPVDLAGGPLRHHQVVIVGAGITGLTMACCLARLGIAAVLIDEDNTVGVKGASSRGICYTQKSLEIFQRLGIYERILAKGVRWSVGRTFAGEDEVYSFDLGQQSNFSLSTQPPFINIQQFYIEGYLVERLQQLGLTDMRWKNRLIGFEQSDELAVLTIDTPAGTYRCTATHVIDATGSASPLRRWLRVPFQSRRGDDRWCIADVRFGKHPPLERHTWVEAPFNGNRAVWQHLMADDVWRIDYQMAPDSDPAVVSSMPEVRARLRQQFGAGTEVEIVWVGPYAYRSECVDRMRCGRVFFMGDSAKIVSPFGARGGNTGVGDADNLAWKLAAVLRGQAPHSLLDSYHDERHEAATENVRVTNRTARFLRPADGIERVIRSATIALAKRYAFARPLINTGRMAVANRYSMSPLCSGTGGISVQNVRLHWADGSSGTLNDLVSWADGRMLLLVFGAMSSQDIGRVRRMARASALCAVQVVATTSVAQAKEHVLDPQAHVAGACGTPAAGAWALVRPDAYIASTGTAIDGGLVRALQKSLAMA